MPLSRIQPDFSGGLYTLDHVVASNDATLDLTVGIDDRFKIYKIIGINLVPVNNDVFGRIQFSISGTFQTSGYSYGGYSQGGTSTLDGAGSDSAGGIDVGIRSVGGDSVNNGAGESLGFWAYLIDPSNAGLNPYCFGQAVWQDDGNRVFSRNFSGAFSNNQTAIDGVRFLFETGNVSSGDIFTMALRTGLTF